MPLILCWWKRQHKPIDVLMSPEALNGMICRCRLIAEIVKNGVVEGCKSQENGLALLWTLGIFALNIGPVPMGFVLDFIGPRYTSILGKCPGLH